MREYALVLLVTAAVTYLLTPLVRRVAVATRAIHEPRARDTHTEPTPLLGGLAMYGGLVAGLLIASRLSFLQDPFQTAGSKSEAGLLLAGGLVVVIGFVDDRWGLSAISKLAGQVAAAGILVWSGQALPWLPLPSGGVFTLESDLSVTLTILIIVVTINAINFIDGLDGLAAGIVAVAAMSFLVYSYTLNRTIGTTSQSVPAVASALLAGMCIGFLPHNFYPARIFMGDIGAMLLGLLLAYGPISSTDSLDPGLLTNYQHTHALDRFPTLLPLLMPAAIFIIPYADLMFAVIRRTRARKPLMAADRQHLHHRLLNIGHSYRQSVLIMYLWAALFSVTVVSLSIVRSPSVVFAVATVIAVLALLPATMPSLRPWRARNKAAPVAAARAVAPRSAMPAPDPPRYSAAVPSAIPPSAIPPSAIPPSATPVRHSLVRRCRQRRDAIWARYTARILTGRWPVPRRGPVPPRLVPVRPVPAPRRCAAAGGPSPRRRSFPGPEPVHRRGPVHQSGPVHQPATLPRPGPVPRPGSLPCPGAVRQPGPGRAVPSSGGGAGGAVRGGPPSPGVTRSPRLSAPTHGPGAAPDGLPLTLLYLRLASTRSDGVSLASPGPCAQCRRNVPICGYFATPSPGQRCARGADPGREGGSGGGSCPVLVINCVRSGKDRVKDFVIPFTSSPATANERPVIPFVNLTGYPHRDSGAATGSCNVRGILFRVSSVAVESPGAM